MAVRFDGSADSLSRARLAGAKTIMGWFRIVVDRNDYSVFFAGGDGSLVGTTNDGVTLIFYDGAIERSSSTALTVGQWYHIALVQTGDTISDTFTVYLNGVSAITNGRAAADVGTNMYVGNDVYSEWLNGRAAHVKIWDAALTAAEVAQEAVVARPVRTANLYLWSPLWASGDVADYSGNGRNWTANGTITTEDGPPVSWGAGVVAPQAGAGGGGTTYEATLGGSLGSSGGVAREGRPVRSGALASAGALLRAASRAVAGTLSPAGALASTRVLIRAYAGSLGSSGALVRQGRPARAGAVTSAGSATKQSARSLAGALGIARSIRFFGTATGGIDRVRIPLTASGGTVATPVNVGAGAFTYECWIRCRYADNATAATDVRFSNIVLDRDIWNDNRGHVPLGVTRNGASLVAITGFNVAGTWASGRGSTNIGDDAWHHVAVSRSGTTARLFVDGVLEATVTVSSGSYAYPTGYTPTGGQDNEYLVIGAEKHDFVPGDGGYDGYVDELRVSDTARYTAGFTAPTAAFTPDANTVGLYHFDATSGTTAADSATVTGAPTDGELRVGGADNGPQWAVGSPFATGGMAGALTALRVLLRSYAGSMTPAGAGVRQGRPVRAGSLASAGTAVRTTLRALVGALAGSGAVVRQARPARGGGLASTGTLDATRAGATTLSGVLGAGGGLASFTARAVAGTLTAAGAAARSSARALAGSLNPSGALSLLRVLLRDYAGALSSAGGMVRGGARQVAGIVGPAGAAARAPARALVGAVLSAGAVVRGAARALSGAASPAGALGVLRVLLRDYAGSITPAGAVAASQAFVRALAGAVAPAGALTRVAARALSGATSMVGTLILNGGALAAGLLRLVQGVARIPRLIQGAAKRPSLDVEEEE